MIETEKKPEQLLKEIHRLREQLARANEAEGKLRELERLYVKTCRDVDSLTREGYMIRWIVNMPQLYLNDDLRIVGHSADFVRLTNKVAEYARQRAGLNVLMRDADVKKVRAYMAWINELEELPYKDGEPWELRYSGPNEDDRIGGQWIMHTGDDKWEIINRDGKYFIRHNAHPQDNQDCCLLSVEQYGGSTEDVRLVFKTRTAPKEENIRDNTCFISVSSGREDVLPDINGYTVALGSNYNALGRLQKQGADVVSRQEKLEPDTDYLVEVERIGGRITRRVVNLKSGEEMPLLYFTDFNAIYESENYIGFYTYSGEAEFYDIEIYTRPSRFKIEQFILPFQIEITPCANELEDRVFELKYVRNEIMGASRHTLIFNDITTRQHNEIRLRESEEKYRKLFEEDRVARSTTTSDGRFIDANQEMLNLAGYTREEFSRLKALDLYVDPSVRRKYLDQLERDTFVRDYEIAFKKKDGTPMDCMITSSIHPATDGSEYFILGSIHDITERKRMEAKLKESQKMEVIGRIASGVAHEVRNPLNAILAISEALSEEIGDEEAYKPYLYHICSQVDRLSTLMKDLLELGKPLQTDEFVPADMFDICSSVLELWHQSSAFKNTEVVLDNATGGERLLVLCNSTKLKQVFLNLLENAAQHSPEGESVELKLIDPGKGKVLIRVTDRGAGISGEVMPEVFKPFFTTRARGAGLGLSIVKNIVETHGGTIELINNDPPPGLRVDVVLPVFEDTDNEE